MTGPEPVTAERLFERVFLPLYPPDARSDLGRARTTDANPGGNPRLLAELEHAAAVFAELAPRALGAPDLALDGSDASVHRLAFALDRERRDALLGAATGDVPELAQLVMHGVAYVGACIVRHHGGSWQLRSPLWESLVRLESRAGTADLALFQWWLKALADDEIGLGRLADRYWLHVESPSAAPDALPVRVAAPRGVPRLTPVTYEALNQHLRAHVPEMCRLGEHFPSGRWFSDLDFRWLDFSLLGNGRMLLVHGRSSRGVHLLWLDGTGLARSAFYPADATHAYELRADGDKLALTLSVQGVRQTHEMLWWGATG